MLPPNYKFVIVNNSGALNDSTSTGVIQLSTRGIHVTPATGKLSYTTLATEDFGFTGGVTIADGAELIGSDYINSGMYINAQVGLTVVHSDGDSADGTFDLYIATAVSATSMQTDGSAYDDAITNGLTFIGSLIWPSGHADGNDAYSGIFVI